MSNPVTYTVNSVTGFYSDSKRLLNRCSKPDRKEYTRIVVACAIGFAIMGFIGFFVRLARQTGIYPNQQYTARILCARAAVVLS